MNKVIQAVREIAGGGWWTKKYQLGEREVEAVSGQRNTSLKRERWRKLVDKKYQLGEREVEEVSGQRKKIVREIGGGHTWTKKYQL